MINFHAKRAAILMQARKGDRQRQPLLTRDQHTVRTRIQEAIIRRSRPPTTALLLGHTGAGAVHAVTSLAKHFFFYGLSNFFSFFKKDLARVHNL